MFSQNGYIDLHIATNYIIFCSYF